MCVWVCGRFHDFAMVLEIFKVLCGFMSFSLGLLAWALADSWQPPRLPTAVQTSIEVLGSHILQGVGGQVDVLKSSPVKLHVG